MDEQATIACQLVFNGFIRLAMTSEYVYGGGVTALASIARAHALYHAPDVFALVQPLLVDIVSRHVRSMGVLMNTLDVDALARIWGSVQPMPSR
jgi:hypothetical protein